MKPTFERILVTREIATQLREKQTPLQRPLNKSHVAFLVEIQKSGNFDGDNGDLIRIDSQGRLFDGNHRLTMIQETGIAEWLWVSKGWPTHAYLTCDQGRTRSLSDYLKIQGETNCNVLASSIQYACAFCLKSPINAHRKKLGALRGLNWLKTHGGIRNIVIPTVDLVPRGMLIGLYYVVEKKDTDLADRFLGPLWELEGAAEHGTKILRQKLIKNKMASRGQRVGRDTMMAWLIKLWNTGNTFDPKLTASDYEASLCF